MAFLIYGDGTIQPVGLRAFSAACSGGSEASQRVATKRPPVTPPADSEAAKGRRHHDFWIEKAAGINVSRHHASGGSRPGSKE